jgi:hypothetical protein
MDQLERVTKQLKDGMAARLSESESTRLKPIDRYGRLVQAATYAQMLTWIVGQKEPNIITMAADLQRKHEEMADALGKSVR